MFTGLARWRVGYDCPILSMGQRRILAAPLRAGSTLSTPCGGNHAPLLANLINTMTRDGVRLDGADHVRRILGVPACRLTRFAFFMARAAAFIARRCSAFFVQRFLSMGIGVLRAKEVIQNKMYVFSLTCSCAYYAMGA